MNPEVLFIEEHKDADVIIWDEETGQVFAAEYRTWRGIPRKFPVRFFFAGGEENINDSSN